MAYGSNLQPTRLTERVESSTLLGISHIPDRGFRFNKKSKDSSGKGNIVEVNEGIYVAIYKLDNCDKAKLDRIEGVGSGYNEETLEVPKFGKCMTYVADSSAVDDSWRPYSWYKHLVLLGCKYHAFPNNYVTLITSFDEMQDCNDKRHAKNMGLVERIENGT